MQKTSFKRTTNVSITKKVSRTQKKSLERKKKCFNNKKSLSNAKKVSRTQKKSFERKKVFQSQKNVGYYGIILWEPKGTLILIIIFSVYNTFFRNAILSTIYNTFFWKFLFCLYVKLSRSPGMSLRPEVHLSIVCIRPKKSE